MLDKHKALFGQAQDLLLPLEDPPALSPLCLGLERGREEETAN